MLTSLGWRLNRRSLDPYLIDGQVKRGVLRARRHLGVSAEHAAWELGNGSQVTAQDTVPFALWVAATSLHDYPTAITARVKAGSRVLYSPSVSSGFGHMSLILSIR
jgi:hypothetical protein